VIAATPMASSPLIIIATTNYLKRTTPVAPDLPFLSPRGAWIAPRARIGVEEPL